MKFIHTSDLHIGKIVNGFPMLEDQRAVLAQVVQCAREEQADAVFLCGDIYDRSVAPAAAVQVFDWFLTSLADLGLKVFVIAGNHDCGERVEFASGILSRAGVHIEGKPGSRRASWTWRTSTALCGSTFCPSPVPPRCGRSMAGSAGISRQLCAPSWPMPGS